MTTKTSMTINDLYDIIVNRRQTAAAGSYVASLFAQGTDRIIQKVGEEATEVVIAAKNDNPTHTISEMADLLFHLLVLMSALDIKPADVLQELSARHQKS